MLQTLQDTLPFYARDGSRYVPTSCSEVPFGCPMRFLFTIHYSENWVVRREDPPNMVYAKVVAVQCL